MIYYIINNDFHVENIKNHIQIKDVKACTIIRIPYSLKNSCKSISDKIITIQTPFRNRWKFWNPFQFYKTKRIINNISFTKHDKIIFLTEFDPINQYIVYRAKKEGAEINLLEEGISFYYLYIFKNKDAYDFRSVFKLYYLRYIIGFRFLRYVSVGKLIWLQMPDRYIDTMLLYFNVCVQRDVNIEVIPNNYKKIDGLNERSAVFLSQPLYESYLTLSEYINILIDNIKVISLDYNCFYFKFHPRDSNEFKALITTKLSNSNIIFSDNITLEDFFLEHKPSTAFSFFSDALFKLRQKGVKVRFLYKNIPELAKEQNLVNLEEIVKRLEDA